MADDSSVTPTPSKSVFAERLVALLLVLYLLVLGLGASSCLFTTFPTKPPEGVASMVKCTVGGWTVFETTSDKALLYAALLAGIIGSFLHAAQSLATYVGNGDFKMSWAAWYVVRPWIGGILGYSLYFVARAGLVGGTGAGDGVNAYGVVAIGLLGGWFSKTTTDKLQEVFTTLFKTNEDDKRKDKLTADVQPVIKDVAPKPVTASVTELSVSGTGFVDGAVASIGQDILDTRFVSPTALTVSLAKVSKRPSGEVTIVVKNPSGTKPEAVPFKIKFEP
jgi:hypothetical protein